MSDHGLLIDALADDLTPVRRPPPAALRALGWTPLCLISGWIATTTLHAAWHRFGVSHLFGALNFATSLGAGVLLIATALELSIPGRRSRLLPLAGLWMLAWSIVCIVDLATGGWPLGHIGDGVYCFKFVAYACTPMAAILGLALRRTYSVHPLRTTLLGAMGISFLAFALLAFCHHGRLQVVDFSMHLAAAALVIAISTIFGSRFVSIPRSSRTFASD
jgi:hypothetical protein